MDSEPSPEDLRNRRNLLIIVGGFFAVVVIGLIISRGGDDESPAFSPPATSPFTTEDPSEPSTPPASPDSEVPPIDCNDMITFAEVDDALGVDDNPALGGGSSGLSLNEECTHTVTADERYFVQISPSGPSDFESSAALLGVSSVPVAGVGQRAVWFGGADSESGGDSGVLAVEETTEHGRLFVRIFVGRPDVDEATQQEIAADLAATALTRFPGVAVEVEAPPEPEVVVFEEEEAPDIAARSLADNLLAREEVGDWSRGEGLVASLRHLAGELGASDVLAAGGVQDPSATLVIFLARAYVENGADGDELAEIERLLGVLTLSDAEEQDLPANGRPGAPWSLAWALALAQEEEPEEPPITCADVPEDELCVDPFDLPDRAGVPAGKYGLFVDTRSGSDWSSDYITVAAEAVLDAAATFEALGGIPATSVVLRQGDEFLYVDSGANDCLVYISDALTGVFQPDAQFQQLIAREMSFCLIAAEFRELISADPAGTRWWTRGLATYLSGVVYERANAEHRSLPAELAAEELATTIEDRSWTNWALFEHLHAAIGVEGNMANISGFPEGGDHAEALAAYPDMDEQFHEFELALTDASLADLGNGTVPYEPRAWDLEIFVPVTAELAVPRFGVRRIAITVPDGQRACYSTVESDEVSTSWRPGTVGESGDWESDGPESLEGESMLVITTVEPLARFELTVTRVTDDASCTEEVPPPTTLGVCDIGCGPSRYYYPA